SLEVAEELETLVFEERVHDERVNAVLEPRLNRTRPSLRGFGGRGILEHVVIPRPRPIAAEQRVANRAGRRVLRAREPEAQTTELLVEAGLQQIAGRPSLRLRDHAAALPAGDSAHGQEAVGANIDFAANLGGE